MLQIFDLVNKLKLQIKNLIIEMPFEVARNYFLQPVKLSVKKKFKIDNKASKISSQLRD